MTSSISGNSIGTGRNPRSEDRPGDVRDGDPHPVENDPILNDGAPAEDLDLFGAGQNIYNAFSDNLFSDGSFELNVMVPKSQLEYIDEKIFWGEDGKPWCRSIQFSP